MLHTRAQKPDTFRALVEDWLPVTRQPAYTFLQTEVWHTTAGYVHSRLFEQLVWSLSCLIKQSLLLLPYESSRFHCVLSLFLKPADLAESLTFFIMGSAETPSVDQSSERVRYLESRYIELLEQRISNLESALGDSSKTNPKSSPPVSQENPVSLNCQWKLPDLLLRREIECKRWPVESKVAIVRRAHTFPRTGYEYGWHRGGTRL